MPRGRPHARSLVAIRSSGADDAGRVVQGALAPGRTRYPGAKPGLEHGPSPSRGTRPRNLVPCAPRTSEPVSPARGRNRGRPANDAEAHLDSTERRSETALGWLP